MKLLHKVLVLLGRTAWCIPTPRLWKNGHLQSLSSTVGAVGLQPGHGLRELGGSCPKIHLLYSCYNIRFISYIMCRSWKNTCHAGLFLTRALLERSKICFLLPGPSLTSWSVVNSCKEGGKKKGPAGIIWAQVQLTTEKCEKNFFIWYDLSNLFIDLKRKRVQRLQFMKENGK